MTMNFSLCSQWCFLIALPSLFIAVLHRLARVLMQITCNVLQSCHRYILYDKRLLNCLPELTTAFNTFDLLLLLLCIRWSWQCFSAWFTSCRSSTASRHVSFLHTTTSSLCSKWLLYVSNLTTEKIKILSAQAFVFYQSTCYLHLSVSFLCDK